VNGKGSKPRPLAISAKEFGERFEAVFGKHERPPKDDLATPPMLAAIRRSVDKTRIKP
jgi:hypothetical protein